MATVPSIVLAAPEMLNVELGGGVVDDFRHLFRHLFCSHILTTFQATVGPGLVAQICDGKLGDPTLPNKLLAGIGSVESAAPSFSLWRLGRMV